MYLTNMVVQIYLNKSYIYLMLIDENFENSMYAPSLNYHIYGLNLAFKQIQTEAKSREIYTGICQISQIQNRKIPFCI